VEEIGKLVLIHNSVQGMSLIWMQVYFQWFIGVLRLKALILTALNLKSAVETMLPRSVLMVLSLAVGMLFFLL
jgi:hypothetical protein